MPLPEDLRKLEDLLTERSRRQKPSESLRDRVFDELRGALPVDEVLTLPVAADVSIDTSAAERRRNAWQFAIAVAVVVLFWMNLSMSATQATDFGFRRAVSSSSDSVESSESNWGMMRQMQPMEAGDALCR
jgi:hypothetical protein